MFAGICWTNATLCEGLHIFMTSGLTCGRGRSMQTPPQRPTATTTPRWQQPRWCRCSNRPHLSPLKMRTRIAFYSLTIKYRYYEWTVPQLSIIIIYSNTWSFLIQWVRVIFSGENLTYWILKKAYFLFVINLIARAIKMGGAWQFAELCIDLWTA